VQLVFVDSAVMLVSACHLLSGDCQKGYSHLINGRILDLQQRKQVVAQKNAATLYQFKKVQTFAGLRARCSEINHEGDTKQLK
jgi:hypothetical protein